VLVKNYSVVGLHWGLYSRRAPELIPVANAALMDLYAAGKIKPLISARMPLAEAPKALERVASGQSTGKILLLI
jgi:NADPH2:quinone reductase